MRIVFTKGDAKYSYLKCIRDDDTSTASKMPEQGIIPHDMIHYIVEQNLAFHGAFFGQLKAGANIDFKLQHNQLAQEIIDKTESWQVESIVEALQALLWSCDFSYSSFIYLVSNACNMRGIPPPLVNTKHFLLILNECYQLSAVWKRTPEGGSISVNF